MLTDLKSLVLLMPALAESASQTAGSGVQVDPDIFDSFHALSEAACLAGLPAAESRFQRRY